MGNRPERILILDDEAPIVDILTSHLTEEGYECTGTVSPLEALEIIEARGPFMAFLTDLKMPELHGIEVVRRSKELDPDLAIVVVTALFDVKNAIQAMRVGADDYVLKPFDLGEISLCVSRAIEKRALVINNRNHQNELEERIRSATAHMEEINRELRTTRDYLEDLLHSTGDAIITCSVEGAFTFANDGAARMFGYSREELLGQSMATLCVGGREEYRHILRLVRENTLLQNYETELRHKNDHLIPVNMSISFVRSNHGESSALLAICKDITHQKELERELKEMSFKDSLTGLYNQRYFYDRLSAEIERARRQSHPLSLLLFDIDKFKTYNDCHGHLAGDHVLQTAGQIVLETTRVHVDLGFRYGGDEFTVILPEADGEQALHIAERIRSAFEGKHFDELTLSIGLMTYKEGYSLRMFIQFADAMMYDAKRSGGNRTFVYTPDSDKQSEDEAS